ncbi:gag-protease polyprotein [Cucumis melo var. makuwa]|uniref:Gag-protease polyprotein n=1 Tax=Cucumis melo var. makuwa TaxID=1194695 RepID=A0A5A7UX89_CUCMM|nr:gag-protease polyprotein [Cucumis melo var. makuwa]
MAIRSFVIRQEKMSPRRGAHRGGGRGGRGARRTQPEEQPAVQAANPNAPITQVDLAAMDQRYQDMLQATLAHFLAAQQTQAAPVQCAVFFLEDRGTVWWEIVERMLGGDVSKITWEQFKESFYAKFFSANVKYAKQQEFLNLEQGDMTVEQYDAEFDMLSCFALNVVKDEEARIEKFARGLRLDL